jgi:hypothetical protein
MGRSTKSNSGSTWKTWFWISLIVLAFVGGFIPQYFHVRQLNQKYTQIQDSYYKTRLTASIHGLYESLAHCRLYLCQGNGKGAQRELQKFYSRLENLSQDPALKDSYRDMIREWLKVKGVNMADINPPRLQIQERIQDLEKDLSRITI